jgi:hypothetical protein
MTKPMPGAPGASRAVRLRESGYPAPGPPARQDRHDSCRRQGESSVRVPYQLAAAFPVQARDVTVTGQVAGADLGNLFPRMFRLPDPRPGIHPGT